jgi:hypothetical protein
MNIKFKKKFFKTSIRKSEISLIKILVKINVIKYIKQLNKNEFIIFLNFNKNSNWICIKNFFKPSAVFFMKKKDILKVSRLKKQILLLSNINGVELSKNTHHGGIILAKIFLNN